MRDTCTLLQRLHPLARAKGGQGHHAWQAGGVPKAETRAAAAAASAAAGRAANHPARGDAAEARQRAAEGGQQAGLCGGGALLLGAGLPAALLAVLLDLGLDAGGSQAEGRGERVWMSENYEVNEGTGHSMGRHGCARVWDLPCAAQRLCRGWVGVGVGKCGAVRRGGANSS